MIFSITMLHIHYTCSKKEASPFLSMIRSVIERLPADWQQRIHDQCMILLISKTYGYSIGHTQKHLILLNINEIENNKLSIREQEFIIAHEFSHFILDHTESNEKEEKEANDLVEKWGFLLSN